MPITYTVDTEQNVVLVTWRGDVTGDEYRAHLRTMLQDPDALRAGRSLTDLREANVLAHGAELNAILDAEALPRLGGRQWKTAVLVSSNVNFGVARQYQILAESENTDGVFRDYAEALAWLLAD
jgi:hypothetical protein